jgi:hypothetical protein
MQKNELQDPLLRAQDLYLQAETELGWLKILSSSRAPLGYIFDIKRTHRDFESAHRQFKNRYHDLSEWVQQVLKPHTFKNDDTPHTHNDNLYKHPVVLKQDFSIAALNARCVLNSLEKSKHSPQSASDYLAIVEDKERSLKNSFAALTHASERHGFSTVAEIPEYQIWMNKLAIRKQQLASYIDSPA